MKIPEGGGKKRAAAKEALKGKKAVRGKINNKARLKGDGK